MSTQIVGSTPLMHEPQKQPCMLHVESPRKVLTCVFSMSTSPVDLLFLGLTNMFFEGN